MRSWRAFRRVIEDAQPEAVADIYYSGMILTGGGSLLKGLKNRLQSELKLRATMPEDPISTVAMGAGILLGRARAIVSLRDPAEPACLAGSGRASCQLVSTDYTDL